jgi:hypothetical protein
MFFAKEDELAIHTIASAAFRILRDLIQERGKNFTAEVLRNGIYGMAQQYAEGKLPKETLNLIENTALMTAIINMLEAERVEGEKFDVSRIDVRPDRIIAPGAQRGVSGPECVDASRWDCTLASAGNSRMKACSTASSCART